LRRVWKVLRYSSVGSFFAGLFFVIQGCSIEREGTLAFILLILMQFCSGPVMPAGDADTGAPITLNRIYWGDQDTTFIHRCLITGALPCSQEVVSTRGPAAGLDVDFVRGFVYWNPLGELLRCSITGSLPCAHETVITVSNVEGIELDIVNGFLYWADRVGNEIRRCDITGALPCVSELVANSATPNHIAVDEVNGYVYWTNDGILIQRCSISGALPCSVETVLTTGVNQSFGIAVDPVGGFVYYGDGGDDDIIRCSTTGVIPCVTPEVVANAQADHPNGLDIDLVNGFLYWAADSGTEGIRRCSYTGPLPCTPVLVHNGDVPDISLGP